MPCASLCRLSHPGPVQDVTFFAAMHAGHELLPYPSCLHQCKHFCDGSHARPCTISCCQHMLSECTIAISPCVHDTCSMTCVAAPSPTHPPASQQPKAMAMARFVKQHCISLAIPPLEPGNLSMNTLTPQAAQCAMVADRYLIGNSENRWCSGTSASSVWVN